MAVTVVMAVVAVVVMVVTAVPMVMVTVAVVEGGVIGCTHHLVAFKQTHTHEQWQGDIALFRTQDARVLFDLSQGRFDGLQTLLIDQIRLVEQQDVAIDHLRASHFTLQQIRAEVFGIDQGDDRVEARLITQLTPQERHGHWQGVCQACGLHHEIVNGVWTGQDSVDGLEQLAVDRTADAAVAQLHHVFPGADHQVVIDADLAEFIHQNGCFHTVLVGEDVVEQCGFARTEKPSENRDRHATGRHHCAGGGGGHGVARGTLHAGRLQSKRSIAWARVRSSVEMPPRSWVLRRMVTLA